MKVGVLSVNDHADRFKRTDLEPVRTGGFDPQPSMKAVVENTLIVCNFEALLDVQGAIAIHGDPTRKGRDAISSLRAGDSSTERRSANEQGRNKGEFARLHLRKA